MADFPPLLSQMSGFRDALIPAAALLAGLVILFVVVWYIRRRRRAKLRMAAVNSICGKCGYVVQGLPTFTCPECGSDLRDVGIARQPSIGRPANSRETMVLMLILAIWTALYALLYACVGTGSYPQNPWDSTNRPVAYGLVDGYFWPYQGKSTHSVALEPASDAYRRITITEQREAKFQGWRNASELRWTGDSPNVGLTQWSITLQLETTNGKVATMDVDPGTLAWKFEDPEKPGTFLSGPTLDGDIILRFMRGNGVDQPSEAPKMEAAAIFDIIERSRQLGTIGSQAAPWAVGRLERIVAQQKARINEPYFTYEFKASRGTATDVYGPAWSIYWLSVPFGLGVYSYGTNWIWGRRRKRQPHGKKGHGGSDGSGGHDPFGPQDGTPLAVPGRRSRTLTVLFTDLKDYTQRAATVSRQELASMLDKNRDIVEGTVSATDGQIVKTIGDAYLITFESATDAVLAALSIQRAASRYNANANSHGIGLLEYRIAVSTGEVTIEGGDVFGTPVNIAARVQALAEPGAVYLTESTLHAINAAEVRCVEVGPRELKGIATPVRLFEARALEN